MAKLLVLVAMLLAFLPMADQVVELVRMELEREPAAIAGEPAPEFTVPPWPQPPCMPGWPCP